MSLNYIRGKPEYLEGVGNIYPVKIKDYDEFNKSSYLLNFSKDHFNNSDLPLLTLVVLGLTNSGIKIENVIKDFENMFSIVLQCKVFFAITNDRQFKIIIDDKNNINSSNYDTVREIIMKQNLIFTPKVYKNEIVQKWAEKVLKARIKNSPKITMEDMLSTISVFSGKSYEELENYTIYQVYADFYRIRKIKGYECAIINRTLGGKAEIEDFAEDLQLFKNPYDDLFVNKNKLNKLDQALKGK